MLWRTAVIQEIGSDRAVVSALVFDEVVYRSVVSWLKELGDRDPVTTYRRETRDAMQRMRSRLRTLWKAIDALDLEMKGTDQLVVDRARHLMETEHLGARDACHAAHAIERGCDWIVSADPDFDELRDIQRLGPGRIH